MKVWFFLLACLGLAASVQADSAVPSDFAYGLELRAQQSVPVLGLTLPERVLRSLTDRELGDLCIFDAQGVQRPHALHVPRDAGRTRIDVPLAHFPLEVSDPRATDGVEVRVERDQLGQIARAFSKPMVAEDLRVVGYLVDAHELSDPFVAVALTIAATRDYTVEVRVEASDDLTVFRPLTTATLAHLENEGRSLDHDLLELPDEVRARYLRLSFVRPPSADLRIDSVRLRVLKPVTAAPRRFVELSRREPDRDQPPTRQEPTRPGQSFWYAITGVFRFDRYSVVLPAQARLIEGSLLSAPTAQGPFRELDRALFRQPPSERELMPTEHGFFELRVSDKGGGVRDGAPQLRMGYLAPRVLFASNDSSAYLLAYGSARARCRSFDEDELSATGADQPAPAPTTDSVRVLRSKTLAGSAALTQPEAPRPLRLYFLWAVLLLAVAVLAAVARKLLRAV